MRAGGDRGLHGRLAPALERADGRDEHVAALHERAHGVGPGDVGDRPFQAAELLGQGADAPLVPGGQHWPRSTIDEGPGGEIARIAGGAEDDDAFCHSVADPSRLAPPERRPAPLALSWRAMDEHVLAERLITYDTATSEGLRAAAGFVKGWLEARELEGRRPRPRRAAGHPRRGRAGRRPDGGAARPPRRGARARGPVHPARRGRPAHRPRRLRHEGRARGHDVRAARRRRAGPGARAVRVRPRRGVRGRLAALDRRPRQGGAHGRLRPHRRAHRPAHRHPGQGRARGAPADLRYRCPRLDPVAGRQRDPQGARCLPPHRDAALQPRVLRPLRPPVDQPRAHHRAATPSTRSPTSARSTSTSASCPTRTPATS